MPAPRMSTLLPAPLPGGRAGGPAQASGRLIRPRAVMVSYTAAAPPALPTSSRKFLRDQPLLLSGILVSPFLPSTRSRTGHGPEVGGPGAGRFAGEVCACRLLSLEVSRTRWRPARGSVWQSSNLGHYPARGLLVVGALGLYSCLTVPPVSAACAREPRDAS